jgi:hypothetical protein
MSVKVKTLWKNDNNDYEPISRVAVIFGSSGLESFQDFPATGRVIFHFECGLLRRVESFDEGPSRRNPHNSKGKI